MTLLIKKIRLKQELRVSIQSFFRLHIFDKIRFWDEVDMKNRVSWTNGQNHENTIKLCKLAGMGKVGTSMGDTFLPCTVIIWTIRCSNLNLHLICTHH